MPRPSPTQGSNPGGYGYLVSHVKVHKVAIDRYGIAYDDTTGIRWPSDIVVTTNLTPDDINHRCSDYTGEEKRCPKPELFHSLQGVITWAKRIQRKEQER